MKIYFLGILATFTVVYASNKLTCKIAPAEVEKDWISMQDPCITKVKEQISAEISAAITYMAMGAHFARDTVNRPGFAKFFFNAASEEREHAIKLIEYLLMRGNIFNDIKPVIANVPKPQNISWSDGHVALNEALRLEAKVTNLILSIIKQCDNLPDYHIVDYLTADFLTEQYKGQRDLAGKSSTLGKMMKSHGALGEFLFDKKLLHGEL